MAVVMAVTVAKATVETVAMAETAETLTFQGQALIQRTLTETKECNRLALWLNMPKGL